MIFIISHKNTIACCKWGFRPMGNITTGTELVRRMNVGEEAKAYAMTCPLITKADGSKLENQVKCVVN
jgi:hypothetical protein